MSKLQVSAIGRVYYFTIPEQRVIYKAIKMYLEENPNSEDAQIIKDDFYRESFE